MDNIIKPAMNMLNNITVLPNEFIDRYMAKADGEYVKIYLLILRLSSLNEPVLVDRIADTLEITRRDVLRAVSYWQKEGLLAKETEPAASAHSQKPAAPVPGQAVPVPVKQNRAASDLKGLISGTELEQLIFMAETYMGHPLSVQELNTLYYISDELGFPPDLLEYLIEYCAEKGKKQLRYMEKVAINWYQQGIDTVQTAIDHSARYTQNVYPVMKAFGITGRNPGPSEMTYITRWNAMGFGTDIILEACNRTLLSTHQASFPYANRILEGWKEAGVSSLSEIKTLDQAYHSKQ